MFPCWFSRKSISLLFMQVTLENIRRHPYVISNACRGENKKTRKTAGTSPCGGLNVLWPLVAGGAGHDPGQFGEPWGVGLEWVSGSRKKRVDERVAGQNGVDEG